MEVTVSMNMIFPILFYPLIDGFKSSGFKNLKS